MFYNYLSKNLIRNVEKESCQNSSKIPTKNHASNILIPSYISKLYNSVFSHNMFRSSFLNFTQQKCILSKSSWKICKVSIKKDLQKDLKIFLKYPARISQQDITSKFYKYINIILSSIQLSRLL